MADIEVGFIHPTDGRIVRARIDDTMTSQEVVDDLVQEGFLAPSTEGYSLSIKGGAQIKPSQSLSLAGLSADGMIRIIPITPAGGSWVPPTAIEAERRVLVSDDRFIPGVRRSQDDRLTIVDIQKSPAAVVMLAHMFDDLQRRFEKQAQDLEIERLRSHSRFTAALILLVSQLVLGIGGNLLTQDKVLAALVLTAGGLQSLLGLYLSFRLPKDPLGEKGRGKD